MTFIKWNYKQFITDYLPSFLRKDRRLDWLNLLSNELINNYNLLINRRENDLFLMKHTGQVASLEHLLNTRIGIVGKPVIIIDAEQIPTYFIGKDGETKPTVINTYDYLGTSYDYNQTKLFAGNDNERPIDIENKLWIGNDTTLHLDLIDYIVKVDTIDYSNSDKLERINYYIKKYNLAGFSFKIQSY